MSDTFFRGEVRHCCLRSAPAKGANTPQHGMPVIGAHVSEPGFPGSGERPACRKGNPPGDLSEFHPSPGLTCRSGFRSTQDPAAFADNPIFRGRSFPSQSHPGKVHYMDLTFESLSGAQPMIKVILILVSPSVRENSSNFSTCSELKR